MAEQQEKTVLFNLKIKEDKASVDAMATSIGALAEQNKKLRAERKNLNLETAEGQKRIQEINKQLDANNAKIKENSSALEKQRLNVGNYGGALDKLVPGLGATIQGFQGMTKSALAFIATPIGAVIGALGLAIAALTSYFKGSEEGQTKFNRIMNVGSAVVGKFSDLVQFLGGFVFENLAKGGEKIIGFLNKFIPGFEEASEALAKFLNLDTSQNISNLQEREILLNRELILKREILKADIENLKLRADSTKNQKEQAKLLQEAETKVNELADAEKNLETLRLNILLEQAKLSNNQIEDNDKIEEQKARLFQLDRERDAALKEIATKQLAISEANKAALQRETEEKQKQADAQSEIDRLKRARELEETYIQNESLSEAEQLLQDRLAEIKADGGNKSLSRAKESLEAKIKLGETETEEARKQAKIQDAINAAKLEGVANIFRQSAQLAKEGTILSKVLGIASATVDTYKAANLALASFPPPIGGILAGVNIATGLGNVAKISGIAGFAEGGLSGTRIAPNHGMYINRSNGDNLLATVKTGEVILNQRQQAMLGGDATFRAMGVPGFAGGGFVDFDSRQALNGMNNELNPLLEQIGKSKVVMIMEDFEYKAAEKSGILSKAKVI